MFLATAIALALEVRAPAAHREVAVELTPGPCLDGDALREGIARTLDLDLRRPMSDGTASRLAVVVVARRGGRDVDIVVEDASRRLRRTLAVDGEACDELRASVVLVAALLLDELWASALVVHIQAPVETPAPLVEPTPPRAPTPPAAISARTRPQWALRTGAFARLVVGDLPNATGGAALEWLIVAPRVVSFGVQLVVWPYRRIPAARFSAMDLALDVCADTVRRSSWALAICVAPRAGSLFASGLDGPTRKAAIRPRVLVDASLDARVQLRGPLWLRGHVGLTVPVIRDRFVLLASEPGASAREIHRAWPVAPLVGAGLELRTALWRRRS